MSSSSTDDEGIGDVSGDVEKSMRFKTFVDFSANLQKFEKSNGQKFFIKNSATLPDGHPVKYGTVTYKCQHGGIFKKKGTGQRQTSSQKTNCGAFIKAKADKMRTFLEIVDCNLEHNHDHQKANNEQPVARDVQFSASRREELLSPLFNQLIHSCIDEVFEEAHQKLVEIIKSQRVPENPVPPGNPTTDDVSTAINDNEFESLENDEVLMTACMTFEEAVLGDEEEGQNEFAEDVATVNVEKAVLEDKAGEEKLPEDVAAGSSKILPSSQSVDGTGNVDLDSVVMEKKISTVGRPKGAVTTAIGRPRKVPKPTAFKAKNKHLKMTSIVAWLVNNSNVTDAVLKGEYFIQKRDINFKEISDSLVDANVDVNLVGQFVEKSCFKELKKAFNDKKKGFFSCSNCLEEIGEIDGIACDQCLLWKHFKCVGLKRVPKSKFWFCPECKR